MIIGSRQKLSKITIEPEIRIGETAIKRARNSKTLGVLIDVISLGTNNSKMFKLKCQEV